MAEIDRFIGQEARYEEWQGMNISQLVEPHRGSARIALRHGETELSYDELLTSIGRVQAGLANRGVTPGDRVVLLAGTTPDFVAVLFGVLRSGAIAVPVNPMAPVPEMQAELDVIKPALIMVGPAGSATLEACSVRCPVVGLPGASVTGGLGYQDFIVGADPEMVDREPSDVALMLFTSGTAGSPKAAMLTHGNLMAAADQVDAHTDGLASADDVALGVLPLFHILGLSMLLGVLLRVGATVVLVERFDPASALELIDRHGVTLISGPPALWGALADQPGVRDRDFSGVRIAISGAATLTRDIAQRVQANLGITLSQGYGLTEASPGLTLGIGTGAPSMSVGRPLPGVQMRLVDASGDDVPVGDKGEVWARGANIFIGYLDDPDATAKALTPDGWLRTGDVAVVDDDGFLYIVDRHKDLILVSGFNVFPGEVEHVLADHPDIQEAAVVGVADPLTGESVMAHVVPVAGSTLDEAAVIAHCEARIARYKCPRSVAIVDDLPRGTTMGKVRRRDLR